MLKWRDGSRRAASGGFTLLEAALATVILGVGVMALVEAHVDFTRHNDWSTSSATANYLANEVRERMRSLPKHDPVTGLFFQTVGSNTTLLGWGKETGEVTVADFDDIDDFDGVVFGSGGTLPGPIDSANRVMPELTIDGTPLLDSNGKQVPMRGWSQSVKVEKVDPMNSALVHASNYFIAASGSSPGLAVDQFPLRVTVTVFYQAPSSTTRQQMAQVVWIAP